MLNSLKDFKETSIGSEVEHCSGILRKSPDIEIDHDNDVISFKIIGPPGTEDRSGGQWTDMLEVGLHVLKYLNDKYPCREDKETIYHLERALEFQAHRTKDREARAVEGKDEV